MSFVRGLASRLRRLIVPHDGRDNSAYWRGRAQAEGTAAVLWTNAHYNRLVREREFATIAPWLARLPPTPQVLDIGCGIGEVARWLLAQREDLRVTGVDFPEMVERAQRELPAFERLRWVGLSAEGYAEPGRFDMVLSSGCYSAIRDRAKCEEAMDVGCRSLRSGGLLVMIDPFHAWKYLARVRMGPAEVVAFMQTRGLQLQAQGGLLFWPVREMLANSDADAETVRRWFWRGERWLALLGQKAWSDYKVLVFRKP
jgi:SAM-dependent methyltransferase